MLVEQPVALAQRTTGRRCWWRTRRSAAAPAASRSTPRPGMLRSVSIGCAAPRGSTTCEADSTLPKTPSSSAEHRLQHPDRDGQRQPDQQAGDQVLLHRRPCSGSRQVERRGAGGRRAGRRRGAPARRLRPAWRRGWRAGIGAACRAVGRLAPPSALRRVAFGAAAAALLPPRKSVAYQPEPLSWKPAAVTCLRSAGAPQAGQTVRSGVGHLLQHVLARGRRTRTCRRRSAWLKLLMQSRQL